jgi:hypothetical protein
MTIKSTNFLTFVIFLVLTDEICIFFSCSDGFFFAVKEVSLLDDGSQGKQSIFQLQQVGLTLPIQFYDLFIPSYVSILCIIFLNFLSGNISFESVST